MSGHNLPYEFPSGRQISDPGNAGTLAINENGLAVCALKSSGAETRTIPAPSEVGQQLLCYADTAGGNITITVNSGVSGLTTVVFATAGDVLRLESITVAGVLKWQMQSPVKGAALTAADAGTVDATYGAAEAAVIENLRTRVGEIQTRLQAAGIIA